LLDVGAGMAGDPPAEHGGTMKKILGALVALAFVVAASPVFAADEPAPAPAGEAAAPAAAPAEAPKAEAPKTEKKVAKKHKKKMKKTETEKKAEEAPAN